MKNVVALYDDATDAEKAITKLADAGLDTSKARVHSRSTINESSTVRAMPSANTAVSSGSNPASPVGGAAATGGAGAVITDDTIESYLINIGVDGEEVAFYTHGIKEGGHIVHIQVPNDQVDKARGALTEAGGRAPQVE